MLHGLISSLQGAVVMKLIKGSLFNFITLIAQTSKTETGTEAGGPLITHKIKTKTTEKKENKCYGTTKLMVKKVTKSP